MSLQSQSIDEEEELYLIWLTRWGSKGSLGRSRGTSISSMGPGLSVGEQALFTLRQQSLSGGALPAFLYYGRAGLADPKLPVEAYGFGGFLGLSGWKRAGAGALVAGIIGFTVGGILGVAIDPVHKWEGGYDETIDYQQTEQMYREMEAPWKSHHVPLH